MDISSHAGGELEMTLQPMRSFWGVYPLISTYAYIHLLQTQIFWKTHFFWCFICFHPFHHPSATPRHAGSVPWARHSGHSGPRGRGKSQVGPGHVQHTAVRWCEG